MRESDNGCTWLLTGGGGNYVMQARPGRVDMALWAQVSERCGLVPRIYQVQNSAGSPCLYDRYWTWTIQEWRNGLAWPETGESAEMAGKALRTLHDVLLSMDRGGYRLVKRDVRYRPLSSEEIRGVKCWAKQNRQDPWAKEAHAAARMLPKMARFCDEMEIAADTDVLPSQLVHMDYHPGNVLFDVKGEVVAILDLDLAMGPPASAVFMAAYQFGFREAFLTGYGPFERGGKMEKQWVAWEMAKQTFWVLRANCLLGEDRWRQDLAKQVRTWQESMEAE